MRPDITRAGWRKSSYSSNGMDCVEIDFEMRSGWRKSTHSSNGIDCVEIDFTKLAVEVRDSKNPTGPTLAFPHTPWSSYLTTLTA
jgi:hypothetical protein